MRDERDALALSETRSLSAQWEHTLAVTDDGYDVLTRLPGYDL